VVKLQVPGEIRVAQFEAATVSDRDRLADGQARLPHAARLAEIDFA
jgi:hypothetical protein